VAVEVLKIIPGETWVNLPWSFEFYDEVQNGETLTGTPAVAVSGTAGITTSGATISGAAVLFTIAVDPSAVVGNRTLHVDVGSSGSSANNLTDTATITVSTAIRTRNSLSVPDDPDRVYAVNFSDHPMVLNGQVLTGTPTVTFDDLTDFTISGESVDAALNLAGFRLHVTDGRAAGLRTGTITVSTTAGSVLKSRFDIILE
jgi:hypothetical protein